MNGQEESCCGKLQILKCPLARSFPSVRTGLHSNGSRGWFGAALEAAGIKDFTGHCLRHTTAGRLVMAGVDLHTVGELMGHRTARVTKRYSHLSVNHKQSPVERISGVPSAIRTASNSSESSGVHSK